MRIIKTIARCSVIFVILGAGFGFFLPPLHKATIELIVNPSFSFKHLENDPFAYDEYLKHQAAMITSPGNLAAVIEKLKLDVSEKYAVADVEKKLRSQIKVKPIGGSLIVATAHTDRDYLSVRIVQELIRNYIDTIKKEKHKLSEDAIEWLNNTSSIAKAISEEESEVEKIKSDENFPEVARQISEGKIQLAKLEEQKRFLSNKLFDVESKITEEGYSEADFLNLLNKPDLREIKDQFHAIERELKSLSQIYTSQHPRIVRLEKEKEKIKNNVLSAVTSYTDDLENQAELIKKQIVIIDESLLKLKDLVSQAHPLLDALRKKEENIKTLQRDLERISERTGKANFFPLEIEISGITPEDIVVVEEYRNYKNILIVSLLLGVFTGSLWYFFTKPKMKKS